MSEFPGLRMMAGLECQYCHGDTEQTQVGSEVVLRCQKCAAWTPLDEHGYAEGCVANDRTRKWRSLNTPMEKIIKATVLAADKRQYSPPAKGGLLGMQWWEIVMSDRPDFQLYASTNAKNESDVAPLPFNVGDHISYVEGKTKGGKPKLIWQAPLPNDKPYQKGVPPSLQTAPTPPGPRPEAVETTARLDNEVRHAKVISITFHKEWKAQDGIKYGYMIGFDNKEQGVAWADERQVPFVPGQDVSYTFDKIYPDGAKRIALTVTGAPVGKEESIMRMSMLKTAVEFHMLRGKQDVTEEEVMATAKLFEKFVTRTT